MISTSSSETMKTWSTRSSPLLGMGNWGSEKGCGQTKVPGQVQRRGRTRIQVSPLPVLDHPVLLSQLRWEKWRKQEQDIITKTAGVYRRWYMNMAPQPYTGATLVLGLLFQHYYNSHDWNLTPGPPYSDNHPLPSHPHVQSSTASLGEPTSNEYTLLVSKSQNFLSRFQILVSCHLPLHELCR